MLDLKKIEVTHNEYENIKEATLYIHVVGNLDEVKYVKAAILDIINRDRP